MEVDDEEYERNLFATADTYLRLLLLDSTT